MLLPLDPGSGRTRRTSTETAALLPSPTGGPEEDTQADLQPFSPSSFSLRPPCPLSPSSSASFSPLPPPLVFPAACTGVVHRTGPQWPRVIDGHCGAAASLTSSLPLCSSTSCPCLTPAQEPREPAPATAAGGSNAAPLQWREAALPLGYIN